MASSLVGGGEADAYFQQSTGVRRGTPWTGRQSIAGLAGTLFHTPKGNEERPVNLTGMSLDCGRKLEYPVRTQDPVTDLAATVPPCSPREGGVPSQKDMLEGCIAGTAKGRSIFSAKPLVRP
ncbi:hypothetical protein ILYODFUR_026783 [Ilyodon furcidens]|uniref:Uncharacterized protein n=1 Tax=Ilyodon furcidens TaxID=33524 RepID=A0ABV0TBK1_9TELE